MNSRKRRTRRRSTRKRSIRRRRGGIPKSTRICRSLANRSQMFSRWAGSYDMTLVNVAQSTGASFSFDNAGLTTLETSASQSLQYFSAGMAFCLDDVFAATEFTDLFQLYRLDRVVLTFTPLNTVSSAANPGTVSNGQLSGVMHSAPYYLNNNAPQAGLAGVRQLREQRGYRVSNVLNSMGKPYKFVVKPRLLQAAYQSGVSYGYSSVAPAWLTTASPDVQHYGYQFIFELSNPDANYHYFNYKFEAQYFLEFKSTR